MTEVGRNQMFLGRRAVPYGGQFVSLWRTLVFCNGFRSSEDEWNTDEEVMNLKAQLRLYLKLRGITAAELARRAGLRKQLISDYLAGVPPRKIEQVKKVADVLGVTLDHLCFGEGEQHPEVLPTTAANLDALIGDGWIGGLFEVRLRRVKR